MKKRFLLFLLFATIGLAAMAQNSSNAYNKGDNLLNAGIGVGSPFFGSGYSASLPVNPSLSYEHGVTDEISVGGQVSYATSKYSNSLFGTAYSFKENATYVGLRGSYHLNDVFSIDNKFDIYGGASLGYVIVNISNSSDFGDSATGSEVGFGLYAGGKYFFSPKTGIYAELGYQSLSFLNIGVAFKF